MSVQLQQQLSLRIKTIHKLPAYQQQEAHWWGNVMRYEQMPHIQGDAPSRRSRDKHPNLKNTRVLFNRTADYMLCLFCERQRSIPWRSHILLIWRKPITAVCTHSKQFGINLNRVCLTGTDVRRSVRLPKKPRRLPSDGLCDMAHCNKKNTASNSIKPCVWMIYFNKFFIPY